MGNYILQRDLPYCKAGTVYSKNDSDLYRDIRVDKNSYLPQLQGMRHERFAIHKDWVEGNPEWFQKEPELQYYVIAQPLNAIVKSDTKIVWSVYKQTREDMGEYAYAEFFSDEEIANAFILHNRPVLSFKDIALWANNDTVWNWTSLKELVKTKL